MPTITAGDRVLVSGANGYIAVWICRHFLENGYTVRGAVRSLEKGRHLTELFKSFGEKFEIVVVADITKDGAFDEAMEGISAVVHTASPVRLTAGDPQELFKPAIQGTLSILQSALVKGKSVKRVVVTSSTGAIINSSVNRNIFDENDWNDPAVQEVIELGSGASPMSKYRASKVHAERAAWDFYTKNAKIINWDLTVLNPPYVLGPAIQDVQKPEDLNSSLRRLYDVVMVEGTPEQTLRESNCFVDVRDLAEAYARALEVEKAGGERIIISTGSYVWQDWLDVANSLSPSPIPSHSNLPRGLPGAGHGVVHSIQYNTAKEARILGIRHRSIEEVVKDTLADFERRAW